MHIAVVGGGSGGYATAADLARSGHSVRFWQRAEAGVAAVRAAGAITFVADGRQDKARLERVTGNLDEAVDGAEVVIISLPAPSHAEVAKRLAPCLTELQIVLLMPGSLGSYVLARELARAGGTLPYAVAETGTLPYLARKIGPASVTAPVRAVRLPTGVFPASRTARTLAVLSSLYAAISPCTDALDAALTNPGVVIHPPLVLLNVGSIDAGRFDVHAPGATPSVRRLINAVDRERIATRAGWGYRGPHYEIATYYDPAHVAEGLFGAAPKTTVTPDGIGQEMLSLDHRYATEDAALGLGLFESAARTASVDTPAINGLVQLFGVLLGRRLSGEGRALERLGLGDLTLREIRAFLHEGWASPAWPMALR